MSEANQTVTVQGTIKTCTHFKDLKVQEGKKERSVEVFPEYDISKLSSQQVADLVGAQLDIIFCRVHNRITPEEVRRSWDGKTIQVDGVWLIANESSKATPEVELQKALAKLGIVMSLDQISKMKADGTLLRAFGL